MNNLFMKILKNLARPHKITKKILKKQEVESQEIGKMSKTLHEVLHEVFEKVLYSVYYKSRDEKQNAPWHLTFIKNYLA